MTTQIISTALNPTVSQDAAQIVEDTNEPIETLDLGLLRHAEDGAFEYDPIVEAAQEFREKLAALLKSFPARAKDISDKLEAHEASEREGVNPMCTRCARFCSECNGTKDGSYTGCIFRR